MYRYHYYFFQTHHKTQKHLSLNAFASYDEFEKNNNDNDTNINSINLKSDYQLIETTNIMNDYLNLSKNLYSLTHINNENCII